MSEKPFKPRFKGYAERVCDSLAGQPFMDLLGAELTHIAPGEVDLTLASRKDLGQQHGFVHGGVVASIADSAAGYAALTLFDEEDGVLTAEFKINFLNPAGGSMLVARGRVLKPGRTLTVCRSDVFSVDNDTETLSASAIMTMAVRQGLKK